MKVPYETILRNLDCLFLSCPVSDQVHRLMGQALVRSQAKLNPFAVIIAGDSGLGKSAIVKAFANRHQAQDSPDQRQARIGYCELESASNVNDFTIKLLEALQIPFKYNFRLRPLRRILREGIKQMGINMLIIDESQHVIQHRTTKQQVNFVDEIKLLIGDTQIAIVLAGTPDVLEASSANDQLDRRACRPIILKQLNFADPQDQSQLYHTVAAMVDVCSPIEFPELLTDDALWRLYCASSGKKGQLAHIFAQVVADCDTDQRNYVTWEHLADAVGSAICTLPLNGENPFSPKFEERASTTAIAQILGMETPVYDRMMRKLGLKK
ncbi:TniB family NTP-binding protein [Motiliproteus sediminis]|uniref:TniB family NTP-binding protein n=1 Tax=Motiliproteus sediminis TaxID=1468178 RepID=UPI001AF00B27